MIKINLASRKHAPGVSAASEPGERTSLQTVFTRLGVNTSEPGDRAAGIRKIIFLVVIAGFAEFSFEDYKAGEIKKLETKNAKVSAEVVRLQGELAKTTGYEETKRSLEADETLIRTKLETIKTLVSKKTQPGKMLMALSTGIPQQVWLSDLKIADSGIQIKGTSTGFESISDFLKSLDESAYFADLTLVNSQQEKDELGVENANFEISAKRRQQ